MYHRVSSARSARRGPRLAASCRVLASGYIDIGIDIGTDTDKDIDIDTDIDIDIDTEIDMDIDIGPGR